MSEFVHLQDGNGERGGGCGGWLLFENLIFIPWRALNWEETRVRDAFCTVLAFSVEDWQDLEGSGGRKSQEKAVAVVSSDPWEK